MAADVEHGDAAKETEKTFKELVREQSVMPLGSRVFSFSTASFSSPVFLVVDLSQGFSRSYTRE